MSFQPTQTQRSRGPLILAVAALVVIIIGGIVYLNRGGRESSAGTESAAASTKPAGSAPAAGTKPAGSAPAAALGPVTNGGDPVATAAVTVVGTPLAAAPAKGGDPALNRPFPTLSGSNVLDGSPLSIGGQSRPMVVMYLAHWCPHCQREVPVITRWIAANGLPGDVDLLAVSTGVDAERDNYPPADWLIKEKWPVRTLADDETGTAFAAAGLSAFPSFVAVNEAGNVVARASGELSVDEFEALLAKARA